MGSIFRIARAELIKIFKRPTVYIMAFLLALIIGGSLFVFTPTKREDTTVDFGSVTESTTVKTYFDKFETDPTYKAVFDKNLVDAKAEISFFKNINDNITELKESYAELMTSIDKLTSDKATEEDKTKLFANFTKYNNSFAKANMVYGTNLDEEPDFVKDYYNSTIYSQINSELTTNNANLSTLSLPILKNYLKNESNLNTLKTTIDTSYAMACNPTKAYLNSCIEIINSSLKNFSAAVGLGSGGTTSANNYRRTLISNVGKFKTSVINIVDFSSHTFAVIKDADYKSFLDNIDTFINTITIKEGSEPRLLDNQNTLNKINTNKYVDSISKVISQITLLDCDSELLTELSKTVTVVEERVAKKHEEMTKFATTNIASKDLNKLNDFNLLASQYKEMQVSLKNYVYYSILTNTVKDFTNSQIQAFFGEEFLGVYNNYQNNEKIITNKYYIDNDIYSFQLGNVFAFNMNSQSETTAFDFMYFAIEISSMIIVIFSIFMAASIFAAEHDSGTIKLLLIRPFKRHKIVSGKLLATLFFSTMFLIFSTIVSTIIGFTVYPTSTIQPILAIFNGVTPFKFNPIALFSIYLFFTLFEIIFYVILSSTLCTLFKSYAGAVTGSFVAYFATIAMNIGFGKHLWYSYSPVVNLNLFKYFGNGFLSNPNSSLSILFNTPMLGNMNYFISLILSAGTMAILLAITYTVFRRRDY